MWEIIRQFIIIKLHLLQSRSQKCTVKFHLTNHRYRRTRCVSVPCTLGCSLACFIRATCPDYCPRNSFCHNTRNSDSQLGIRLVVIWLLPRETTTAERKSPEEYYRDRMNQIQVGPVIKCEVLILNLQVFLKIGHTAPYWFFNKRKGENGQFYIHKEKTTWCFRKLHFEEVKILTEGSISTFVNRLKYIPIRLS
jgi:hypothetical protein